MSENIEYNILKPFGPGIGLVKLPDNIITKLITITDDILSNPERVNYGNNLVGQIEEENLIPIKLLKTENLYDFFNSIVNEHLSRQLINQNIQTEITEMWVNSQYENEYNPIHWHEGCTISVTLYLKIPEYVSRNIKGKTIDDGNIVFINNNHNTPFASVENGVWSPKPEVGDMYLWPSRLLHGVYPFKGEGERRSIAFNALHTHI